MTNLLELESLRTKEELTTYLNANGIKRTNEEIENLKKQYKEYTKTNKCDLTKQQLDQVIGGMSLLIFDRSIICEKNKDFQHTMFSKSFKKNFDKDFANTLCQALDRVFVENSAVVTDRLNNVMVFFDDGKEEFNLIHIGKKDEAKIQTNRLQSRIIDITLFVSGEEVTADRIYEIAPKNMLSETDEVKNYINTHRTLLTSALRSYDSCLLDLKNQGNPINPDSIKGLVPFAQKMQFHGRVINPQQDTIVEGKPAGDTLEVDANNPLNPVTKGTFQQLPIDEDKPKLRIFHIRHDAQQNVLDHVSPEVINEILDKRFEAEHTNIGTGELIIIVSSSDQQEKETQSKLQNGGPIDGKQRCDLSPTLTPTDIGDHQLKVDKGKDASDSTSSTDSMNSSVISTPTGSQEPKTTMSLNDETLNQEKRIEEHGKAFPILCKMLNGEGLNIWKSSLMIFCVALCLTGAFAMGYWAAPAALKINNKNSNTETP